MSFNWDEHHKRVRAEIRKVAKAVFGVKLPEPFEEFRPEGHPRIVFHPMRKFGEPYVDGAFVRTVSLFNLYEVEGKDATAVAEYHDVEVADVLAAVRFHEAYPNLLTRRGTYRKSAAKESEA